MSSRRTFKSPWNAYLGKCPTVDRYLNEEILGHDATGDAKLRRPPRSLKWGTLHFLNVLMRTASQPILVDNPISGLLIYIGIFAANYQVGLGALLGGFSAVLVEFLFEFQSWSALRNGSGTFNGLLLGGVTISVYPQFYNISYIPYFVWIFIPFGSAACSMLTAAMSEVFRPFKMPFLALPFCTIASIAFISLRPEFEPIEDIPFPPENITALEEQELEGSMKICWVEVLKGIFFSASQVFGVRCTKTSILVDVAVFLYSPILLVFTVIGGAIGTLLGTYFVPISNMKAVYDGVFGFNSLLSCGFIGCVYNVCGPKSIILALFNAAVTSIVQVALSRQFLIPVFAFPFSFTSLIFSLIKSPNLVRTTGPAGYPEGWILQHRRSLKVPTENGIGERSEDPELKKSLKENEEA